MKIVSKLSTLLFALGFISGAANAQDVNTSTESLDTITNDTPIILTENIGKQISFEKHLNFSTEPFDNAMGVYHTSHYSHSSHRSHYSHYSSSY